MTRWFVPGRLEFLGKHTDYAGGPSLLCAVERGFTFTAAARPDGRVIVRNERTGERADGVVRQGHWSSYVFNVARQLRGRGADISFSSDLPSAAGLSSSSALTVGTYLCLTGTTGGEELAEHLGAVETGVGTHGGSEDHVAILCARPNALVQYRFAPIHFERAIPLPSSLVFVIAGSGVVAEKTGNALESYNRAAQRAAAALELWRTHSGSNAPTLAAALADHLNANNALMRTLLVKDRDLAKRVTQFFVESQLVRAAGDAILRSDWNRLGILVDTSQQNAEELLRNQVPETIYLAREARELGAIAASAFGAGFGGSVYALVRSGEGESFMARWRERYLARFPARAAAAEFFVTRAGAPARML